MTKKQLSNRNVINRKSPKNEDSYLNAYRKINPNAAKKDNLDIAAVTTVSGEIGHALVPEKINRSKDKDVHRGYAFIPDSELKKYM